VHILFFLDNQPVATSMFVPASHGVMGIYNVAVVPEARKKGVGAAVMVETMKEGLKFGAKVAVLESTNMGKPLYERLGFKTVNSCELYTKHFH